MTICVLAYHETPSSYLASVRTSVYVLIVVLVVLGFYTL